VDWFGKDVRMRPLAEDESKVFVSLTASPMAMEHWATQYINHVVVTRPEHLRKKIKESLENALKKY
jgi:predicted DNA-binding transcriptional regulator YafY